MALGAFALVGDAYAFLFVPFTAVSAILLWQRPRHPVGWLLSVFGVLGSANTLAVGYAQHGYAAVPPLTGADVAAWLQSWEWTIYVGLLGTVFVTFPSGHPSSRGRAILAALWTLVALNVVASAFFSVMPDERFAEYRNPFAVALVWDFPPTIPLMFLALASASVHLLARMRGSRGVEREQMKWVAYAAVMFAASLILRVFVADALGAGEIADLLFFVAFLLVPIALSVAILRYRLYEIDVLIRRTLVYAVLSAILLGAYVAGVTVLGIILAPFAGGGVPVALSTLGVVALFQPVRRRIGTAVDRRFYRARYDAERTLEAFSARLRDEVDLGALERELVAAAVEALRPRSASLWLRRNDERTAGS